MSRWEFLCLAIQSLARLSLARLSLQSLGSGAGRLPVPGEPSTRVTSPGVSRWEFPREKKFLKKKLAENEVLDIIRQFQNPQRYY